MPDDFTATTETTGTVTVGGAATGVIEKARDVDWFAVELVAGRTYVIDLKGSGSEALGDAMLYGLFDGEGSRVARRDRDGGEGNNARIVFTATESGAYYIAARGERKDDTGAYTVSVRVHDPDETAAGATDLGDIDTGGRQVEHDSVDGGADRVDYYSFTLTERQEVTLSLRRQDANADLFLEDLDGTVLQSSTRSGTRNEEITATLDAGTYHVRVEAQEEGGNAYVLRAQAEDPGVTEAPAAEPAAQQQSPGTPGQSTPANVSEPDGEDFAADISTKGKIAVGGSVTGYTQGIPTGFTQVAYDRDWFAIEMKAGTTYQIDLKGSSTGDGTSINPDLGPIYNSHGNLVYDWANWDNVRDGGTGRNDRAVFTPNADGTYYIDAGAAPPHSWYWWPLPGTYTLSVEEVDAM